MGGGELPQDSSSGESNAFSRVLDADDTADLVTGTSAAAYPLADLQLLDIGAALQGLGDESGVPVTMTMLRLRLPEVRQTSKPAAYALSAFTASAPDPLSAHDVVFSSQETPSSPRHSTLTRARWNRLRWYSTRRLWCSLGTRRRRRWSDRRHP